MGVDLQSKPRLQATAKEVLSLLTRTQKETSNSGTVSRHHTCVRYGKICHVRIIHHEEISQA